MKLLPVFILVALIAFLIGVSVQSTFIAPFTATSDFESGIPDSEQLTEDQGNLPDVSDNSLPAASVKTHQLPNNSGSYTVNTSAEKVVLNGNFRIPDFYKLNYNFIFPKNGGDISGSLKGVCEGLIKGKSDVPDSIGEARIEGTFSGDCKPIPGLGFKTKASGTFEGELKFKEDKVHIIYQINEPYQTRGGFELLF